MGCRTGVETHLKPLLLLYVAEYEALGLEFIFTDGSAKTTEGIGGLRGVRLSSRVGPVGFEAPQGEPFAKRVDGIHTMLPAHFVSSRWVHKRVPRRTPSFQWPRRKF